MLYILDYLIKIKPKEQYQNHQKKKEEEELNDEMMK